jgi:predicted  nucleic acid-binding Zn-ribbon protein
MSAALQMQLEEVERARKGLEEEIEQVRREAEGVRRELRDAREDCESASDSRRGMGADNDSEAGGYRSERCAERSARWSHCGGVAADISSPSADGP